jgi:hypothetical protein
MHLAIALILFPLAVMLSTPEATPINSSPGLGIEAFPAGEDPDVIPVADVGGPLQVTPGSQRTLAAGTYECCYVFAPQDLDVIWTVSPVEGVTIDNAGLLTVGEDVPDGTVINVTANRDPAGQSAGVLVHVYAPDEHPLVGLWREEAHVACDTGDEAVPDEPIGELRFDADGTFSVTWHPFEVYRDYWGTYEANRETGKLVLKVESGNIPTPADFDGEGSFEFEEDGSLVLHDIWLGSAPGSDAADPGCGHVFSPM